MCLAIPGQILQMEADEGPFRIATVDFDGVRKKVILNYVPEAAVGNFVIVHVGFAISVVREAEALETFAYLEKIRAHEISQ
jgi:hydrogenase expression/formation protein HypC